MYFQTYEIPITAAGQVKRFSFKPSNNPKRCIGYIFKATKYNATKTIADVSLSFNGGADVLIQEQLRSTDPATMSKIEMLRINKQLNKNALISGFVRDDSILTPPYKILLTLKFE